MPEASIPKGVYGTDRNRMGFTTSMDLFNIRMDGRMPIAGA
jgi:hypothetical protein